jgi:hypothetical protein
MAGTILERILFTCRHEFSWPRRSGDGSYYQVCIQCGSKYRYDWSTMRRVARLERDPDQEPPTAATKKPARKCAGKGGWHPRERRLRVNVPVLYRIKGNSEWLNGRSLNISRSGLLFSADQLLPLEAPVELIFEMPAEICGTAGAKVLCRARIARAEDDFPPRLAAAISDYDFLEKDKVSGM